MSTVNLQRPVFETFFQSTKDLETFKSPFYSTAEANELRKIAKEVEDEALKQDAESYPSRQFEAAKDKIKNLSNLTNPKTLNTAISPHITTIECDYQSKFQSQWKVVEEKNGTKLQCSALSSSNITYEYHIKYYSAETTSVQPIAKQFEKILSQQNLIQPRCFEYKHFEENVNKIITKMKDIERWEKKYEEDRTKTENKISKMWFVTRFLFNIKEYLTDRGFKSFLKQQKAELKDDKLIFRIQHEPGILEIKKLFERYKDILPAIRSRMPEDLAQKLDECTDLLQKITYPSGYRVTEPDQKRTAEDYQKDPREYLSEEDPRIECTDKVKTMIQEEEASRSNVLLRKKEENLQTVTLQAPS